MKIYVAGPMTGLPDLNYPAFFKAADGLRALGHEALNPAENVVSPATWLGFMRASLRQISDADGIAMLPGWHTSRGAAIERRLGLDLDLDVRPIEEWLGGVA